jgi:SAM-dependent methyltransferase
MPNNAHGIALQLVGEGKKVLELGAAAGHVTSALVERGNTVYAVESDRSLESALREITPHVLISDLDRLELGVQLAGHTFDVVLAGDVLEHTIHAPLILDQVRRLLDPAGFIVVSLPNIAHGDVRLALINGDFQYQDTGLLDRTHRVFYTRESACELLESNGFCDLEVFSSTTPIGTTEIKPRLELLPHTIVDFVQRDPQSTVYQYVIRGRPRQLSESPVVKHVKSNNPTSGDPDLNNLVLRDHIEFLHSLNKELLKENKGLEERQKMLDERLRVASGLAEFENRDEYLGNLAELGEAKARLAQLEENLRSTTHRLQAEMTRAYEAEKRLIVAEREAGQVVVARQELRRVYASKTWRIGRFVMLPVRAIKRLFR